MKRDRLEQLIELLRSGKALYSEDMARHLQVSPATIRRDFEFLTSTGEARRFHGGIRAMEEQVDPAVPSILRGRWHSKIKMRLAEYVAKELPRVGTCFVSGGTTTACLGNFLRGSNLRIVTNSLALLDSCMEHPSTAPTVQLTGGIYNHKSRILIGVESERTIEHFHADVAVISPSAIDEFSLYDYREDMAQLQRRMVDNATRLVVMVDSSKLGEQEMCRSVDASRISLLITNFDPDKHAVIVALRARGIQVAVIPDEGDSIE